MVTAEASVRGFICPELRKRVDFHVTRPYRGHNRSRLGWITIDGAKVLELGYYTFIKESNGLCGAMRPVGGSRYGVWLGTADEETKWSLNQTDEIHPPQQLGDAMREYLDLPVKTALNSPNPFLRALAIIDRRIGRRTLESLKIAEHEHSLIKAFYTLRMSTLSAERPEKT